MNEYNKQIIEEFRANGGKVGGPFEGAPMLLLTHTGAKSGQQHTNPLVYMADGERWLIFASMGGAPKDPQWFRNLKASPQVSIEVGTETIEVEAEELTGEERDRLWAKNKAERPTFGEYEQRTTRVIPVVALRRR